MLVIKHARHFAWSVGTVFEQFGIHGRLLEWRSAPRYLTVGVRLYDPRHLRKAMRLTSEIAHVAGIGEGSAIPPIAVVLLGGQLVYQIGLPEYILVRSRKIRLWTDVYLSDLYQFEQEPDDGLLVGMGLYETPVYFGFSHGTAHALVCGTSGSGKSELLTTITYQLMAHYSPEEMGIIIIDPKGDLGERFFDKQHLLCQPISEMGDIISAINYVHQEYQRRREHNLRDERRLVIVIDEADDERVLNDSPTYNQLLDFVRRGRSLNINVVLGVHTPDQQSLGAIGKELTNRYLGKVSTATASGQLQGGLELHKLVGQGDFYHVTGGQHTRFQVALTDEDALEGLPVGDIPMALNGKSGQTAFFNLPERKPAHRPRIPVTGKMLAYYVFNGPEAVQQGEAEHFGLTRRGHERHRREAQAFIAAYRDLEARVTRTKGRNGHGKL